MLAMPSPADVFHIVSLTRTDVSYGVQHEWIGMSFKNLRRMGSLNAKFGPLATAVKKGMVVRKLCEVYFLAPFSSEAISAFREKYGQKDAFSVYFFNDTAVALTKEFGVHLPAPIGTITRGEMEEAPGGLGTFLHWDTFSVP
jgi:hypothetical protein